MRPKKYDRELVARLTHQGYSAAEVAEQVGCHKRTVDRLRAELGMTTPTQSPHQRGPISPERYEKVRRLAEDGASIREIERTLGVHRRTVRKYFPEAGWTSSQAAIHVNDKRRAEREVRRKWQV